VGTWFPVVKVGTAHRWRQLINRDREHDSGYWDYPPHRVAPPDVSLRFVRWFDFDELAFRDLRHFLVRIASASRNDIVGRAALIECDYAAVLLDEKAFHDNGIAKP
jgi:hypothetical protein